MRKPKKWGAALPTKTPRTLNRVAGILPQPRGIIRGRPVREVPEAGLADKAVLPEVAEIMRENARLRCEVVSLKIEASRMREALEDAKEGGS